MHFFKLSPEAKEIRRQLEDMPVIRRFRTSPLPDIVPLVLVMYAAQKDVDIHFEDGLLLKPDDKDLCKDKMVSRLYRMTTAQLLNEKCREAEELGREIAPLKGEAFKEALPAFLYRFIREKTWGEDYQYLYPDSLERVLRRILMDHKALSIYESGSGLGLVSQIYDGWERYDAFEPGRVNILFAELLQIILGKNEVMYASRDYLQVPEMMNPYDTVILKLIDPSTKEYDSFEHEIKMVKGLLTLVTWKYAVVIVNYDFCVGPEYEAIRKLICSCRVLEEVVECGFGFLHRSYRSAVLVFNRDERENQDVVFSQVGTFLTSYRGYKSFSVTNDQLSGCHYVFESLLYRKDEREAGGSQDGTDGNCVQFGSLVKSIVPSFRGRLSNVSEPFPCILDEYYETTLTRMILPKAPIRHELTKIMQRTMACQSGSCVSILLLDENIVSYRVCRIDSKGEYALPPYRTLSIVPADAVDTSYFITWLFDPDGGLYPLKAIASMVIATYRHTMFENGYLWDILLTRPVKVILDRKKQEEIVRETIDGELVIGESDARYGVVMVGSPLSDDEKESLPRWGISVISETDRVTGRDSLEDILKAESERPVRRIDAVFFDVNVDSAGAAVGYGGLFCAMKATGNDIPLVVISDIELDSFGPAEKYMFNLLKKDNHIFVFKKDVNAVMNAVRDLRDRLDSNKSPERAVKMKYSEELGLAESIDPSGDMPVNLVKALRGEFEDVEDPKEVSERIGLLRQGAETVFNNAKERGLLPPLTFLGAMQQFLADGDYFDNGTMRCYRLTEDVMPETLSCALGYFVTIVNAGSHANQEGKLDVIGYISRVARSTNVYRSCAFILMDLLRWYGSLNADGPLYEETIPFRDDDLVKKVRNGNQDYYYIGSVHLKYSPGLVEGIPGRDIKFKRVSLEKYLPPTGVGSKIRYFLTEYRIDR